MHTIGNYYHIYNRGAHKEKIFNVRDDYQRFIKLLFVGNDYRRLIPRWNYTNYWNHKRKPLVEIVAYCLMPNHFHLCLKEVTSNGVEIFLHKICTAYVMFYNKKYRHSGTIFQGSYQSKCINDDNYLRYVIQYIHLNPYGLNEPDMDKLTRLDHMTEAIKSSRKYEYSSYRDYLKEIRPENAIITRQRSDLDRSS
jgi:putative transposase